MDFGKKGVRRQRSVWALASQLRIYRIKAGKMDDWLSGWTEGVRPLRQKLGFRIDGAWVARGENLFVWILSYNGPEGFAARDVAYYASEERKALRPDPAALIERSEHHMIETAVPSRS